MKKAAGIILCILMLGLILCSCGSFEIQGIENFNENDCNFGLNCGLLPENRDFLNAYPYESGIYHYWKNTYGPAKAKTYVQLQYSSETYAEAKETCFAYYTLSEETHTYGSYTLQIIVDAEHHCLDLNDPSNFWLLGTNDEMHTLIFIAYLNQNDDHPAFMSTDFHTFLAEEFEEFG